MSELCNKCGGEFRRVHPLTAIVPLLECVDCGRQIPRGAIDISPEPTACTSGRCQVCDMCAERGDREYDERRDAA